ncbi:MULTISPECIES: molybdate ABC transporter permease subunit [unclassified Pseudoalteromonas]|uniref:molybdate ABC transporter permease subunit n=1 Tax=unclassified Pseudoalteromonas TaxID=194690 RepID=UPI0018FE0353|nr:MULTISPECIES: molybdate ABC transporter permease subunit [unclassified Pseudoalteromonas]MBS3798024.1 molybdate ABC transporter permease subunit [Pseudoalteromonas sp. BDTF-M6]
MLSNLVYDALWVTVKLATLTTLILMLVGLPLAWWLNASRSIMARVVESVITLPLILPPTVLGFYLLVAFSPDSFIGSQFSALTSRPLAFSFTGILLGSLLYSLPFVIGPLQSAFAQFDHRLSEMGRSLGYGRLQTFIRVTLPVCKHGIMSATLLCFAHTVGEFGVILMIGGNIPGETQVLSIAIFDAVEAMDYDAAHRMSLGLFVFAIITLTFINILKGGGQKHAGH